MLLADFEGIGTPSAVLVKLEDGEVRGGKEQSECEVMRFGGDAADP